MKYPKIEIKVDETNRVVVGFMYGKQIKAIAKCNKEDTFDKDFGIKLVAAKTKKAYIKRRIQGLNKTKREFLKNVNQGINEAEAELLKQTNRVEEIKNEKYPNNK